jgi:hypothetical protein
MEPAAAPSDRDYDSVLYGPRSPSVGDKHAEVARFLTEPRIDIKADPLEWWRANNARYPTIAVQARIYLAIPATTAPSERLFSHGAIIVNKRRSRLNPETVETLTFLHQALKAYPTTP